MLSRPCPIHPAALLSAPCPPLTNHQLRCLERTIAEWRPPPTGFPCPATRTTLQHFPPSIVQLWVLLVQPHSARKSALGSSSWSLGTHRHLFCFFFHLTLTISIVAQVAHAVDYFPPKLEWRVNRSLIYSLLPGLSPLREL